MKIWIVIGAIAAFLIAITPLAWLTNHRFDRKSEPRIHVFWEMDTQAKFKSQTYNVLFADRRAMRPQIPGTVARGELKKDEFLHRGIENGKFAEGYPPSVPIVEDTLIRGEKKYNIYCANCHGHAGYGDGMINRRAELRQEPLWVTPTSMHSQQVLERPNGHIFNTITNGIRNMAAYGDKIAPEDRWAIVAYIRALQRSQNASLADVPQELRSRLEPPEAPAEQDESSEM